MVPSSHYACHQGTRRKRHRSNHNADPSLGIAAVDFKDDARRVTPAFALRGELSIMARRDIGNDALAPAVQRRKVWDSTRGRKRARGGRKASRWLSRQGRQCTMSALVGCRFRRYFR